MQPAKNMSRSYVSPKARENREKIFCIKKAKSVFRTLDYCVMQNAIFFFFGPVFFRYTQLQIPHFVCLHICVLNQLRCHFYRVLVTKAAPSEGFYHSDTNAFIMRESSSVAQCLKASVIDMHFSCGIFLSIIRLIFPSHIVKCAAFRLRFA